MSKEQSTPLTSRLKNLVSQFSHGNDDSAKRYSVYGRRALSFKELRARFDGEIPDPKHRIDLEPVFRMLGIKWMPRKILGIVGDILDAHLDADDAFSRDSEFSFTIFSEEDLGDSMLKLIRRELAERIQSEVGTVKERTLEEIQSEYGETFRKFLRRIDVEALVGSGKLDADWFLKTGAEIVCQILEEHLSPNEAYVRGPGTVFFVFLPGLAGEIADIKFNAIKAAITYQLRYSEGTGWAKDEKSTVPVAEPRSAPTTPPGAATSIVKASRQPSIDPHQQNLWSRAIEQMTFAGLSYNERLAHLPWEMEIACSPMWLVRNRLITSYVARPIGEHRTTVAPPPQREATYEEEMQMAAPDLPLTLRTVGHVERILAERMKVVIVIPVHLFTLENPAYRAVFLLFCGHLGEAASQLIVFELAGVPITINPSRLKSAIQVLKARGRTVLGRTSLTPRGINHWKDAGVHAVGCDLQEWTRPEAAAISAFDAFAEAGARSGLRTYLQGLSTTSLATAAVCAGYDYVAGSAICPESTEPRGIHEFDAGNLYAWLPSGS